jgi:hypothetical protein
MTAFTIPAICWFFIFCEDCGGAHWMLYIFSMGSVGGPMLLFFIPLILALSNYVVGWKSGWIVDWNHRWTFWVGYFACVMWNVLLIVYSLFMAPAIKIWYMTRGYDIDEEIAKQREIKARTRAEEAEKAKDRAAVRQCRINPSLCGRVADDQKERQAEYEAMQEAAN